LAKERLTDIRKALDSFIFVNRFISVESPCLYIYEKDSSFADHKRDIINSDYRVRLTKKNRIDSNGVKCLSEYLSRYLKLTVYNMNVDSLKLSGTAQITYAYPASSIIQLLGFAQALPDKTNSFFNKFITLNGIFMLYPEDNKYRIKVVLTDLPYDSRDAYFGYLEIVKDAFRETQEKVYIFNFDLMSLSKGDSNNQIGEKFTSSSHMKEMQYHADLAYHVLKNINSGNLVQKANAIWLDNFLKNPGCPQCKPVYNAAKYGVGHLLFQLPNTSPTPAH
jgi:hypothetical protein